MNKKEAYEQVKGKLDSLGIVIETVEHEPALTTEQADSFIVGIDGVRTKTMFLTNKKKTAWFLVILDEDTRMDMKGFGEAAGTKQIKMASADSLFDKLKLPPGVVSPFGLLNNDDHDVQVYIEKAILDEKRMSFHPNTNEMTVFIDTPDLLRFLEDIGHPAHVLEM